MTNKAKLHRTARDRAVSDLLRIRDEVGTLNRPIYQVAADASGYSIRQLQRQVAAHDAANSPDAQHRFEVDADVIATVMLTCGNISGARRRLSRDGVPVPSLSTFRRRVLDAMGGTSMAYAKHGPAGVRNARVHLPRAKESRGFTYLLDHTELPIFAIPDGHRTAERPWLTAVMDAETRYVLGWVLTFGTPTAEEVRAALIGAFTIRLAPDGETPVGGLPERAQWDRGQDFLSDLITQSCMRLQVTPVALPAYSPHLKGSLERWWRFLKEDALAPLPGYIDSGRNDRGEYLLAAKALPEQSLLNALRSWIEGYNTVHVHRVLGSTPLQAWQADPTPLREVPRDQLWQDFLISDHKPKVGKAGIRFKGVDYLDVHNELDHVIGRTVEVRHLPHDRSFIEVFHDGEHLATCYPADSLRADDQITFLQARHEAQRAANAEFRSANRLRSNRDDAHTLTTITGRGQKTRRDILGPELDLHQDADQALAALKKLPDQRQGSLW